MYAVACSCCSNSLTCSACPESSNYANYRSRDYYHGALELAGSRCILNKQFTTPVGLSGKPGINVRELRVIQQPASAVFCRRRLSASWRVWRQPA
jgi:hypothetical protein